MLQSLAYGLDFLRDQVADVASDDLVAQPNGFPNHPAWVIGHLTFTFQMLGGTIGLAAWLPDGFASTFGPGSVPVGDANLYPPKTDALATLRDGQTRISAAVERIDAVRLAEPFPVEAYRDVFPTIRHALTQVLVGHTAYHVGQVAIWRKARRIGPIARSFE